MKLLIALDYLWLLLSTIIPQIMTHIVDSNSWKIIDDQQQYTANIIIQYFQLGKFYASDLIIIYQSVLWYKFLAERYNSGLDVIFAILLKLISQTYPIFVISITSMIFGTISGSTVLLEVLNQKQWFCRQDYSTEIFGTDNYLFMITALLYYVFNKKRLNIVKSYCIVGVVSLFCRQVLITLIYFQKQLIQQKYRLLYDCNPLVSLYIPSFCFAICSFIQPYKVTFTKMQNTKLQHKEARIIEISRNPFLKVAALNANIIIIVFDALYNQDSSKYLICQLTVHLMQFILLLIILVSHFEDHILCKTGCSEYNTKSQYNFPLNDLFVYSFLSQQFLISIIDHYLGCQIIGPHNSFLYIIIFEGVLVALFMLGKLFKLMSSFFCTIGYDFVIKMYEVLKKKQIFEAIRWEFQLEGSDINVKQ